MVNSNLRVVALHQARAITIQVLLRSRARFHRQNPSHSIPSSVSARDRSQAACLRRLAISAIVARRSRSRSGLIPKTDQRRACGQCHGYALHLLGALYSDLPPSPWLALGPNRRSAGAAFPARRCRGSSAKIEKRGSGNSHSLRRIIY
jgi:hypothetical protein